MKSRTVIFLLFLALLLIFCAHDDKSVIRVMTFNVQVDVTTDGENAWTNRKDMVASTIRFHHADLIGIQEALIHQVKDLAELLPMYNWVGVGRDDGKDAGEFTAIFYLKSRFEYEKGNTFWLSESPDHPGLGWDAACNRTLTWALFKDRIKNKEFYHFNTHLDHMGVIARQESVKLLLSSIQKIAGSEATIVTGDFNSEPDSEVYQAMIQGTGGHPKVELQDTEHASLFAHHGPHTTFNGFDLNKLKENPRLIDYIFITPHFDVINHGTLADNQDGRFPSDHFPVLAEMVWGS